MTDSVVPPPSDLAMPSDAPTLAGRGKLKIFFGACPGVGKTYAMLQAARKQWADGRRVLVIAADAHGSAETQALLEGLPCLAGGFDVEAVRRHVPALAVVDDLAAGNPASTSRVKRWQEVEALLAGGIDVYATLNVQQLDSLNSAVGKLTGWHGRDAVPDAVFDAADEVTLVDVPPDEWLARLNAGNVALPAADRPTALQAYRTGNLIALRELALRRAADRLGAQRQAFRADRGVEHRPKAQPPQQVVPPPRPAWHGYLWSTLWCLLITLVALALRPLFDAVNVVMLWLPVVMMAALRYGRGPGAWASFLSVLCFDVFFVPPVFSLRVEDSQYLLTFGLMLTVALVVGHLAARLRFEADVAHRREQRASALAQLSRELSGALVVEQIAEIAARHVGAMTNAQVALWLPDSQEQVRVIGLSDLATEAMSAQWVYDHQRPLAIGGARFTDASIRHLPLRAPMRTRGVLSLKLNVPDQPVSAEDEHLLDAFAAQIALALERIHYVEVAQDALVSMEGERMRNSLLSAISHDLRTPLTSLVGMASTLAEQALPESTRRTLAVTLHDQARRMSGLVSNLLDMARLQSGGVRLNKEWQAVEEVVGSALRLTADGLSGHKVEVNVPATLPLCEFDAVLVERVLCNLLDNAAKYAPAGSTVTIAAQAQPDALLVRVDDNGPGLPPGASEHLFDRFTRGDHEASTPGAGLGLALCKAIVEAHGGRIRAERPPAGGARFVFTLPLGTPPSPDDEP